MLIGKEFGFEASHQLPRHDGKCKDLHGHSWKLKVGVIGPVNEKTGFVMDYAELKRRVDPLITRLDHSHLGTMDGISKARVSTPEGFYPTSENLIVWIGFQLYLQLDWYILELKETCTSSCILMREEYEKITWNR